jgi:hypothetical protein
MTMSRVFVVFFALLSIYTHQGCSGSEPAATSAPATTAAATTADAPTVAPTVAAVSGPEPTEAPAPIIVTSAPETLVDTGYGYGYGYRMLADEMDNFVI